MEVEEDDPVVKEMDVYLSQANHLFLLQYPLRPVQVPYASESVLSARVCGEGEKVKGLELDLKVRPRGENYSTSRGENYAHMVTLGSESGSEKQSGAYDSDLFDKITLASNPISLKNGQYAAAALREGALHITPLQGIMQMRPSLSYLDRADVGAKKLEEAASDDGGGGDTTESEGEEAKPVTVRFERVVNPARAAQKKVGQKKTFTETKRGLRAWKNLVFNGLESEEAEDERRLLIAGEVDQRDKFYMSEKEYLDCIFPKEACLQEESSKGASPPTGMPSLENIRQLPLKKQVVEMLRNAHMIQFGQLCSLLGVSGAKMRSVLEMVLSCSVLVQGCWVVASHLIFPDPNEAAKRNARDYILWCFSQRRIVPRKDIMGVVKLPNEVVRQMMQSLAEQRFIPQQGWEFKLETDHDFISRNANIVANEEEKWRKRHKELLGEINTKSPSASSSKAMAAMDTTPADGLLSGGGRGDSGKEKGKGKGKLRDSGAPERDERPKAPLTPSRSAASLTPQAIAMATNTIAVDTSAVAMDVDPISEVATDMGASPMDVAVSSTAIQSLLTQAFSPTTTSPKIPTVCKNVDVSVSESAENLTMVTIKQEQPPIKQKQPSAEIKQEQTRTADMEQESTIADYKITDLQPTTALDYQSSVASNVKREPCSAELESALVVFCAEALGRGVLEWCDIKDKLLLKQTSEPPGHLLREQGVSDNLLEKGLRLCGAVEVGQPLGRRLFALTHDDKCRSAILEMYQKQKSFRKKQLVDTLNSRNDSIPEKLVVKALKELCYGKGGHWRLLGT